jgi:cathepsin B
MTIVLSSTPPSTLSTRQFLSIGSLTKGRSNLLSHYSKNKRIAAVPLPDHFDARVKWPKCTSISTIYDQGACGDCWAVSTVMTATDRWCISKNQTENPILSVESMVSCCKVCGYGCADGFPNYAWSWLAGMKGAPYGIPTGGPQNNRQWCTKYTLSACNHYSTPNNTLPSCESGPPDKTPQCPTHCDLDTKYKIQLSNDIHQFSKAFAIPSNEIDIMNEIYENGPVTAGFNVYSDWIHYPVGTSSNQVYKPQGGTEMGGHAVRIIGWGVSKDHVKYWLIANSFGGKWGLNGYFKMARGVGAAGIEQSVVAGLV